MPHQRQVIRDKVAALLTGNTAAGSRVYANRFVPARVKELPAVLVYGLSEGVDDDSLATAPRELTRTLDLAVDGIVGVGDGVDDAMDDIALEIETAMHADPYLGGNAGDSILDSTEITIEPDGDRLVGRVALTYSIIYRTLAPEPPADEDLDDFVQVEAAYDLGGEQDPADQASDVFTVEES